MTTTTNQPVKAGFPNAAHEAPQHSLDLHSLIVKSPASTFFMRVDGPQLEDMGIYSNDIVVIDKAAPVRPGSLVVAYLDGRFVVRRYKKGGRTSTDEPGLHIWGVVTHTVHSHGV